MARHRINTEAMADPHRLECHSAHMSLAGAFFSAHFDRSSFLSQGQRLLVIGGGLSAVHASLKAIKRGLKVTLCVRRELRERSFDLPLSWFDTRKVNKHLFEFFSLELQKRPAFMRNVKSGGSGPEQYLAEIREYQKAGRVTILEGWNVEQAVLRSDSPGPATVTVALSDGEVHIHSEFERVLLATGSQLDCERHPIFSKILGTWSCPVVEGLPAVGKDLQWPTNPDIFVLGAMGALQIGPHAHNLMGGRYGARLVASKLGIYRKPVAVKQAESENMFAALDDSD